MNEETIETGAAQGVEGSAAADQPVLALVVLWSRDDPAHVGACIPVPLTGSTTPWLFGRGEALTTDKYPRLTPLRQRPDQNEPVPPFEARSLSRSQLSIRPAGAATFRVTNVGRSRLWVNGNPVEEAEIKAGDLLEIGTQLCLFCTWRPRKLIGPTPAASHRFGEADASGFVGESPAAWKLRGEIARAAVSSAHVLILGASGTGKELVARAIHSLSAVKGPLITRNATTLPESLVDAELFGNAKGYPNAGMPERPGLVGAADQGTLFLDEFGELALGVQAHLLRLLDSGEYQRLGETTIRHSKLRIVAATNRDEAALRADILSRFGFRINVPDLSLRLEDVPLIARCLFQAIARDDPEHYGALSTADGEPRFGVSWIRQLVQKLPPGNARGLRNLLLAGSLDLQKTPPDRDTLPPPPSARLGAHAEDSVEPTELQAVLDANNGSIEKTWRALGLPNRFAMMRLVRKHGLVVRKHAGKRDKSR